MNEHTTAPAPDAAQQARAKAELAQQRERSAAFGRATEARFISDAQLHGLTVCWPFGIQTGYDCVVDRGGRLFRVQVKGSHLKRREKRLSARYTFTHLCKRPGKAERDGFDVIALWLADEGKWILLPRANVPAGSMHVTARTRYRAGLEDWGIFER